MASPICLSLITSLITSSITSLITSGAFQLGGRQAVDYAKPMSKHPLPDRPPSAPIPTPLDLPLEWRVSSGLVDYDAALQEMEARAHAIRQSMAGELIWLLQHPPVYTAGTSAKKEDLLNPKDALIRQTGRGGEWTYHGPGQRVVYILLDISKRGQDVRRFVHEVEGWAIATLSALGITADRRQGFPGVWVDGQHPQKMPPQKITAIGVRLTKWVSWHGMAINFNPDLAAFDGIVPCGIYDGGVTSINRINDRISLKALDQALLQNFAASFPFDDG